MTAAEAARAPDRSTPGRRRVWIVAAVVVLVAATAFLLLRGGGGHEGEDAEPPGVQATTAVARVADFPSTVVALGTVVPGPGAEARPAAPAPTRVTRVLVAQGDAVAAGQPLVVLDASVFQPRLEQAQSTLASARESYARQERLVEQGITPRKELESAAADLADARAALAEARRNRELATVRSPIPGVVTRVDVAIGQPVDANQPLVDIVDPTGLSILFRLSPDDAARVAPGAAVELSLRGGETGETGEERASIPLGAGTVAGVGAAVDAGSGSVAVRVVPTAPGRQLLAGESVGGRITIGVRPNTVVVPIGALVPGDEGVHVFVVDSDGIAHETPVVVGGRSATEAAIVSGLNGGERVVTEGAYGVSDGARIEEPGG